jgi:hypothetical protein
MATFFGILWPFLIYYVILFVVSYVVVEYGQNYLYDEVTPGVATKVALGALVLASILTWSRTNFFSMFTTEISSSVLLAIAWVGVFILVYRFHPWHGFGLAMATLLIFAGMSTIVVDSMLTPRPAGRLDTAVEGNKPLRRPSYGTSTTPQPEAAPAPKK